MTFRLPFQILRAVSRPSSPNKLLNTNNLGNEFQRKNLSSFVNTSTNRRILRCSYTNCLRQNISTPAHYLPRYSIQYRFKSTNYEIRKNLENRKKVRRQHKCYDRKCVRKLAFRQTTREECEQCIGFPVPDKCPKMGRLKPAYDDSQLQWNHDCPVDICADSQRMDDLKGVKVVRKKLPKLVNNDCQRCIPRVPTKAPKLVRPERQYDPYKMEQERDCDKDLCNIDPPRMDDVRGYAIKPKTLPTLPLKDNCVECVNYVPKYAPKLVPPKPKYDPSEMKWQHPPCRDFCDDASPRMDDVRGYAVKPKKLPTLPLQDNCVECVNFVPKCAPKLVSPKRKYDPSQMKWQHPPCKDFCDDASPRMDDVRGVKIEKKSLPKLNANKCEKCAVQVPKKAPKLIRLSKRYDDFEMKWDHNNCPKGACEEHPARSDALMGYKIEKKTLPKLTISKECTYCTDTVPTTAPELVRPTKKYDDSKLKWEHPPCKDFCDDASPRMDDVRGYKVKSKKLKAIPLSNGCRLCTDILPTKAPKLVRPERQYDPYKMEQERDCYKDLCNIDPPRMDDVRGYAIKPKTLPTLPLKDNCVECVNYVPTYAPKLVPPKPKYDPSEMKWQHPPCRDFCDDASPRMDDVVGYKVIPMDLPKIPAPNNCEKCVNFTPKYAPELKRPKRKYDPSTLEASPCKCADLCDLDPPRMDDVMCWKPKKKKLPSFNMGGQTRCYSTLTAAGNRLAYPIYSTKNYTKLHEKAFLNSRRYSKEKELQYSPQFPKVCPKFKLKGCKPHSGRHCADTFDRECVKTEAPYNAYSDCMDGWWEYPLSECTNWNEVMLQPQKQVSGYFYKLTPPPPKWGHVDPSLERKCIANKPPDPEPLDETDRWENPCPNHRPSNCSNRARKHCNVPRDYPPCKKLEAPYKSFSDRCPQFPELILTECDQADKYYKDQMVSYSGTSEKRPPCKPAKKPCGKLKTPDACTKLPEFMKKRQPVKCKSCDTVKNVQIGGKNYKCKSVQIAKKCGGKDEKIEAMVCASKDCEKLICICKPAKPDPSGSNPCKTSKSKCGDKGDSKTMMTCASKDTGKKEVCLCKPVSKGESKGNINCPTKKVSSNSKPVCEKSSNSSCGLSGMNMQAAVCKKSIKFACPPPPPPPPPTLWKKICAYFRARPGCPGPNDWKQKELEDKARKAAEAAGLELCRPKCKKVCIDKKKLADKMMGSGKSCPPRNPCCPKPKKSSCCPEPKKSSCCPKPKKVSCCPKRKKMTFCPKPKTSSCCPKPTKSPCFPLPKKSPCCPKPKKKKKPCCPPPKESPCCPKPKCKPKKKKSPCCPKPKKSPCCPKPKCKPKKKKNPCCPKPKCKPKKKKNPCKPKKSSCCPKPKKNPCKPKSSCTSNKPKKSIIVGPSCKKQKKKYSTYVAKNRYFSTYSRVNNQMKKKNNKILSNQNNIDTEANSLSYSKRSTFSNISHSYLRLNNNYVGKIYKLKLTKIGIRNALISRNCEQEPFTICHLCKVIPRHDTVSKHVKPDIKGLKLKLNTERIKACN